MDPFWTTALSLTGLFAVGAFVFYSLYKQWLSLPLFEKLTSKQTYDLFRVFLFLTFAFAVLTLGFAAFKLYLERPATPTASAEELNRILEERHEVGKKEFAAVQADPSVPEDKKKAAAEIGAEYDALGAKARDANVQGRAIEYHELTKRIIQLLESDKAKKALPQPARESILSKGCYIPDLDGKRRWPPGTSIE